MFLYLSRYISHLIQHSTPGQQSIGGGGQAYLAGWNTWRLIGRPYENNVEKNKKTAPRHLPGCF